MHNPIAYCLLGLEKGSSQDEIKQVHRRLARKFHPDKNPGDKIAAIMFRLIQTAYEVLQRNESKDTPVERFCLIVSAAFIGFVSQAAKAYKRCEQDNEEKGINLDIKA